jgi:flagellum-specific ATP synthase
VLESVSRVASAVTTPEQRTAGTSLRRLMAAHREAKDLLEIGAYVAGTNPVVDRAVQLEAGITSFLQQDMHDPAPIAESWSRLQALVGAE